MLLAGLPWPALMAILGQVSGKNNGLKCGQNFADFNSVVINRTERSAAPESVLGVRVSPQPLKSFDQLLCCLLDISKEVIVVAGQGPFYRGSIIVPQILDGPSQPGSCLSSLSV